MLKSGIFFIHSFEYMQYNTVEYVVRLVNITYMKKRYNGLK